MPLEYPPPSVSVDPARLLVHTYAAGATIVRIYDPETSHRPSPWTFRFNGPRLRFDHHRGGAGPNRVTPPADDPVRGIYYAARDLEGAVVEVFGDSPRIVTRGTNRVVFARLTQSIRVLDLRGHGGMRAGTSAGISGTETRSLTHAWARYFYDRRDIYGTLDGLLYANSHNAMDAVAVFERALPAIASTVRTVRRLDNPDLELQLLDIAARNGLTIE